MSRLVRTLFPALLIALLALPRQALACSVCFGASDALVSKSLNAGVLVLVGVVVAVLCSIAYTAVVWSRHAKALSSTSQD